MGSNSRLKFVSAQNKSRLVKYDRAEFIRRQRKDSPEELTVSDHDRPWIMVVIVLVLPPFAYLGSVPLFVLLRPKLSDDRVGFLTQELYHLIDHTVVANDHYDVNRWHFITHVGDGRLSSFMRPYELPFSPIPSILQFLGWWNLYPIASELEYFDDVIDDWRLKGDLILYPKLLRPIAHGQQYIRVNEPFIFR
jgi:hypothetical protein